MNVRDLSYFGVWLLFLTIEIVAADSTDFHTYIKNVSVPQSEITLDSTVEGRSFYSGNAFFDIETPDLEVVVHAYLEEIPFKPYIVYTQPPFRGQSRFIKIDSLCSGDIGLISSKTQCVVHWSYSTTYAANHCRIKIGTGNFLYAKTQDSLEGQTRWIYNYNNIGLLASTQIESLSSGSTSSRLIVPKYTLGGQIMIDDTGSPFAVNGYDKLERMTFSKEADDLGFVLHFFYGYVYDQKNRAIQKQQLHFGSTPQMPGTPFNVATFSYDSLNRVTTETTSLSYIFDNPIFWPVSHTFNTIYNKTWFYNNNMASPNQSYTLYFDKDRNLMQLCSISQFYFYNLSGRLDSLHSIVNGLDSIGEIYGPYSYSERRDILIYDTQDFAYTSETWEKYHSPDSAFKREPFTNCYRREYDNIGNITKQFDFCGTDEQLLWTMSYNSYNAPIVQQVPDRMNPGRNYNYFFKWNLLNLDSAKEYYHE